MAFRVAQSYQECSPAGRTVSLRRAASPGPMARLYRTCASGWEMLSVVKLKFSSNGSTFPEPGNYNLLLHKNGASWRFWAIAAFVCTECLMWIFPLLQFHEDVSVFSYPASILMLLFMGNKSVSPTTGLWPFLRYICCRSVLSVCLALKSNMSPLLWLLERLCSTPIYSLMAAEHIGIKRHSIQYF